MIDDDHVGITWIRIKIDIMCGMPAKPIFSPDMSSYALVTLYYNSCIISYMFTCRQFESDDILHDDMCDSMLLYTMI